MWFNLDRALNGRRNRKPSRVSLLISLAKIKLTTHPPSCWTPFHNVTIGAVEATNNLRGNQTGFGPILRFSLGVNTQNPILREHKIKMLQISQQTLPFLQKTR